MSNLDEDKIDSFHAGIGTIKHYKHDGSIFARPGKAAAESPRCPPCDKGLYKPIQGQYEIRVLEIKPGTGNETLRGALHHCSVDNDGVTSEFVRTWAISTSDFTTPVYYTALSYTWGEDVFNATIECDGCEKKITKSLEAAMKQFRQPHDSIMMWIDQICINQDNEAEKMKQIPLMGMIYKRARSTVIWLGEAGNGSSSALQLIERITSVLHFTLSEVDMNELESIDLPAEESQAWRELWDLLSRPWFTRVWIIQEAILSQGDRTWFACGEYLMPWDTLTAACRHLKTSGISRNLHERFDPGLRQQRDICQMVENLDSAKSNGRTTLFSLLTFVRYSSCSDPKDRIYGLLGVCLFSDRDAVMKNDRLGSTAVELYVNMTVHHLLEVPKLLMRLTPVLAALGHESPDLPSWVPDWRVPPKMHALGQEMAYAVYQATGPFKKMMLRERQSEKPTVRINREKTELTIQGVFFDTLVEISTLFIDPDLTHENPTTGNQTLLNAVAFVSQLRHTGSEYNVFDALWKSLVAGKNGDGMLRCPESFAEVFSFLLDQTTGRSPSVPGQTYSVRQRRPKGKGGLELSSLEKRTLGQTFQEVRVALKRALKNRRLGITSKGYLGLFPEHVKKGDVVYVFETCALPSTLRSVGDGKFRFIGECFVHGIMEGEAIEPENPCMVDVTVV